MAIRKTKTEDLDIVMDIYNKGVEIQKKTGNLNQWVDGYPSRELIIEDIKNGVSYVIERGDKIVGVMALIPGEDPTYDKIYDGEWIDNSPYATIHRIAALEEERGICDESFKWSLEKYGNIRVDTHKDNKIMQKVVLRNGFSYCGIIYIADGTPRLAYQKLLQEEV